MNAQEIFDKVALHLLTQNRKSEFFDSKKARIGEGNRCAYRGDDGAKCAVGCLINDESYHSNLEGHGVLNSDVLFALMHSGIDVNQRHNKYMLEGLQGIHDDVVVSEWKETLKALAHKYKLNTDAIDNLPQP